MVTSRSGIPIEPFYAQQDTVLRREAPGEFPFTRGRLSRPGTRGGWIHRELSGEGSPEDSNRQLHYLFGLGQTGLDIIGDGPSMSMLDADHPLAAHSVGTQGASLCRAGDFEVLLRDIPLERVSVSMSLPYAFGLAGLIHAASAVDTPLKELRGSTILGPLYGADAGYETFLPVALQSRLAVDVMQYSAQHLPRFHAYVEDTYFFSECGLDAIEELALGFVQIRHLVRQTIARGVPVDAFAPRIALLVNCSMDFFEEVAKIRAARRIYATMMREDFGARDPRSCSINVTSHTSGLTLTGEQPVNNVIRGAVQGLALAMAGVQAMEISAFDEGFRTPSKEAHLVALRTQQILEKETGVTRIVDPLGGSYYVEHLTGAIEERVRGMVAEIEARGDPVQLSEQGFFRDLFGRASVRYQQQLESGALQVVGKNCHRMDPADDRLLKDIAEGKIEPAYARIEEIRRFRNERAVEPVKRALKQVLADATTPDTNLIPAVCAAGRAGATMGEVAGAMRLAYGCAWDPLGYVSALI